MNGNDELLAELEQSHEAQLNTEQRTKTERLEQLAEEKENVEAQLAEMVRKPRLVAVQKQVRELRADFDFKKNNMQGEQDRLKKIEKDLQGLLAQCAAKNSEHEALTTEKKR